MKLSLKYFNLKKINKVFSLVVLMFMPIFLAGCNSIGKIKLQLMASENINPDQYNQSLPLAISCYQLKDNKRFNSASFYELWKDSEAYLKEDSLSNLGIMLLPGKNTNKFVALNSKAKYIACVALFNRPEENWKDIVKLDNKFLTKNLNISVKGNSINIL